MMAIGGTHHHHQPTKMYPMPTNSPSKQEDDADQSNG